MSVEASIESIDALHEEDRLEAALAMADDALGQHPGDAGLLLRKARLLGALDRGDEAMDMYERQRVTLLATRPRTPHHWQEAGFSLYEQAHLARRLRRGPESRALILEAVARLGSIALPAAWYEAADWAWEDGEHDVAGRLYHDAMFKAGECFDRQIQPDRRTPAFARRGAFPSLGLDRTDARLSPRGRRPRPAGPRARHRSDVRAYRWVAGGAAHSRPGARVCRRPRRRCGRPRRLHGAGAGPACPGLARAARLQDGPAGRPGGHPLDRAPQPGRRRLLQRGMRVCRSGRIAEGARRPLYEHHRPCTRQRGRGRGL